MSLRSFGPFACESAGVARGDRDSRYSYCMGTGVGAADCAAAGVAEAVGEGTMVGELLRKGSGSAMMMHPAISGTKTRQTHSNARFMI